MMSGQRPREAVIATRTMTDARGAASHPPGDLLYPRSSRLMGSRLRQIISIASSPDSRSRPRRTIRRRGGIIGLTEAVARSRRARHLRERIALASSARRCSTSWRRHEGEDSLQTPLGRLIGRRSWPSTSLPATRPSPSPGDLAQRRLLRLIGGAEARASSPGSPGLSFSLGIGGLVNPRWVMDFVVFVSDGAPSCSVSPRIYGGLFARWASSPSSRRQSAPIRAPCS
jgi:hypothetical protein